MKKLTIIILLTVIAASLFAGNGQFEKPDYKKIGEAVKDKQSKFYYPGLFSRYEKADTTLTSEELRYVYYGYFFSKSYSVFGPSDYRDSLAAVIKKDSLGPEDHRKVLQYEKKILASDPFSLRDLNMMAQACILMADTLGANQNAVKIQMVVVAILSSGDGKSEETAWHVVSVGNEYDLLKYLGFKFGGGQSLTKGGCDYLQVAQNEYGIDGFYFDVNMLLQKEQEAFKK